MCTQIAVMRALGYSKRETAARISTPKHPGGLTEKAVYNHSNLTTHKQTIETLAVWASNVIRERRVEIKELNASMLRQEMEKELGESWAQILAAVRNGDVESAKWHIEQVIGKAKGSMDVHGTGGFVHVHLMPQTQAKIDEQERDIAESQMMIRNLLRPPQPAIDITPEVNVAGAG